MRYLITILLLYATLNVCFSQTEFKIYGSLRQLMHDNDTTEKVRLNLMGPIFNYYGVGAAAGLDGEIMIIDGETYVTKALNGSLATDKSTDVGAALLVMAQVEAWDTLTLITDLQSPGEVDAYISELSLKGPFPFMILTEEGNIKWHVISPPKSIEEAEDHKNLGLNGKYNGKALILGFFSKSHHGVFTHHGEDTHMHFQSADKLYSGHVDELSISKNDKLLIPENLQK